MSAAAVFLENFDNDLRATETQKLGFDKGIFFLERMDHRRTVADVRRAVIDELFFFFGLGNHRITVLRPDGNPKQIDKNGDPNEAF